MQENKRKIIILLIVVFLLTLCVVYVPHCHAAVAGSYDFLSSAQKKLATGNLTGALWETVKGDIMLAFKGLLYGVFKLTALLLGAAGVLFGWVVKTENVKAVLDNTAIYESWKMVRDTLNLAFILVLLFSAFCTIFQVEKYHLKKILLTLVIMALLVNFSFPVSRVIIDASNVMFYFILNTMLSGRGGDGITADFADYSGIAKIIAPNKLENTEISYILAIIIFTFILMITFLVLAVMFVIRLVALGILIIFSPIGFVAAIFPSTKHYADDWWSNLFKYSFFAPIMIFMMAIALNIMAVMRGDKTISDSFLEVAGNNTTANTSMIADMAKFSIPIVILWAGLITAQKLSIAGAGVVTNQAKKFAGWAGRLPWRGIKTAAVATGVPGGMKQTYDQFRRTGKLFGKQMPLYKGSEGRKALEAKWATRLGVTGAKEQDIKKRAEEMKKNNVSVSEREQLAAGGDAAAVYSLADDKLIKQETYDKFLAANKDKDIHETLDVKLKQTRTDLIAIRKSRDQEEIQKVQQANPAWNPQQVMDYIVQKEMGKMDSEKWANQDWDEILKPLAPGAAQQQVQDWQRKVAATQWTFSPQNMTVAAQSEIRKRINPNKKAALNAQNIPV